jgi:uncharacterized protein YkwD
MGKPHLRDRALLALAIVAVLSEWTAASAQGVDVEQYKDQVVALINQQRGIVGLPPLQRVAPLDAAAQAYSESMMRATAGGPVYLSHTGPDGSSLASRVSATGYNWYTLGEDLAAGQSTPDQAVAQWMISKEHRANILNPDFSDAGVGIAVGPGTWADGRQDPQVIWWTIDFGQESGGPSPGAPAPAPPTAAVSGYSTLDGTPVDAASFGTLIQISGQNLGVSGTVAFHGRPTSAISWSPTSILALVPLQPSYPDTGPVTITLPDQVATGASFTTEQPGAPAPVPAPPPNPFSGDPTGAAPPFWSTGSVSAPPPPSIHELVDDSSRTLLTARQGQLFLIHGSGFGTNLLRQSQVLFVTPYGAQLAGAIWDWSDGSITTFAPYWSGRVQVVVEVNTSGTPVSSNRVNLTVE